MPHSNIIRKAREWGSCAYGVGEVYACALTIYSLANASISYKEKQVIKFLEGLISSKRD